MRLSFANGEHADVVVEGGVVSFGSAGGNAVVLHGRDVVARHARMTVDSRGIVLEVLAAAARTHVNARPVREKALLRCGDVVCFGQATIVLKTDRDDAIATRIPPLPTASDDESPAPARVVLRGVSGNHFGKSIAINRSLSVGRDAHNGLVIDEAGVAGRHALFEHVGNAVYLRSLDAADGMLVNGVRVRNAVVHPGDQIEFERHHFVVEAPGLPLRGQLAEATRDTETHEAVEVADGDAPRNQHAIWWLIGVAAVIAGGLAWLIWRGA